MVVSRRKARAGVERALFVSLLLVATLLPATPNAAAFDDYGLGCGNKTSAGITFSSDPEWGYTIQYGANANLTLEQAVRRGHASWIGPVIKRPNGQAALQDSGHPYTMDITETQGDVLAQASCILTQIAFDRSHLNDFQDGTAVLSGLSTHEWGHVWGLGHAGRYDSHGGVAPSMSTCWNDFYEQQYIAQDDSAGIQYQINKSGSYGAATANLSFEEGTRSSVPKWWGLQLVGSWQLRSGGVDGTPTYLRIYGSSYYTAIFSTSRLTDYFYDGDQAGAKVKARANYKKIASSETGYVLVQAKWKHVDYSGTNDKNTHCQIRDDINDSTQYSGPWSVISTYCYPSSSWDFCDTATGTVPDL